MTSHEPPGWPPVRESIDAKMRELRDGLVARMPDVAVEIETHQSQYFPLRTYASFWRQGDRVAEQRLVLGVYIHQPSGFLARALKVHADIGWEDGATLAETGVTSVSLSEDTWRVSLMNAVEATAQWVASQQGTVEKLVGELPECAQESTEEAPSQ